MKLTKNKILITGGASGIGFGLAERFAREENEVIICGRRSSALAGAKGKVPSLITKTCDLTKIEDRENLYNWVAKEHGDLNVLINNAGVQQWMSIADPDFFQRAKEEMDINMASPVHLTSLFLNIASLNTIVNVTSGLAFAPLARVPVYCATKAFFHSFTLSLRYTLRLRGVEVIELIPPALNTDLGGKGIHDSFPPVSAFVDAAFEQLRQGKQEITFGFSEAMVKAGPDEVQKAFNRMNPSE